MSSPLDSIKIERLCVSSAEWQCDLLWYRSWSCSGRQCDARSSRFRGGGSGSVYARWAHIQSRSVGGHATRRRRSYIGRRHHQLPLYASISISVGRCSSRYVFRVSEGRFRGLYQRHELGHLARADEASRKSKRKGRCRRNRVMIERVQLIGEVGKVTGSVRMGWSAFREEGVKVGGG